MLLVVGDGSVAKGIHGEAIVYLKSEDYAMGNQKRFGIAL